MSFRMILPVYRNCRMLSRWPVRDVAFWDGFTRIDPFVEMENRFRRMTKLFDFPSTQYYYKDMDKWITDSSDKALFTRKMSLRGFEPTDIKVKLDGNKLVVEAKRESEDKGKESDSFTSQQFYSSLTMPENVDLAKLRMSMNEAGTLKVSAPLQAVEGNDGTETEIPVSFETDQTVAKD